MAKYFSDQFVPLATAATTSILADGTTPRIPERRQAAPLRYYRTLVRNLGTDDLVRIGDELRLFTVRSGDVPVRLKLNARAAWSASFAGDVGLYKVGSNHDGALLAAASVNMLADTVDLGTNGALAYTDVLGNAGAGMTLNEDLGKTFWEIANDRVAGLTYTVDPQELWDVVLTITADDLGSSANGVLTAWMWFT